MHRHDPGPETDRRAVAAGLLSLIRLLAAESPVLVAVDDIQWLDPSSQQAIAFTARRLPEHVGLLATERIDHPAVGTACAWLQLPKPEAITRIRVSPLSLGGLNAVISDRLGGRMPRPTMAQISEISGGNPLYALELARAMGAVSGGAAAPLPGSLAELVRVRIDGLDTDVKEVLQASSCAQTPTIDLVAHTVGLDHERVATLLGDAADGGIIAIDGERIQFAHPLLSRGIYASTGHGRRRKFHRRLAEISREPELRARHLALSSVSGSPKTLSALDEAAKIARARGAPAAAAELLDLAIGLGGDTPERRMRSAYNHRDAGDYRRSEDLLNTTIDELGPGLLRAEALSHLAAVRVFDGDFPQAAELLERALADATDDTVVRGQILVTLSFALFNTGRLAAAARTVEDAVAVATRVDDPHLLSQALTIRTNQRFVRGSGVDAESLQRALALEDPKAPIPMAFRASAQHATIMSWTGDLDRARAELAEIRQRCIDRGEENDLTHVMFNSFQVEVWLGDFAAATGIAEEAIERAHQMGGDLALAMALAMRAQLAAYAGERSQTYADSDAALAASLRCGAYILAVWPMTARGFLEVSLGDHDAALATLEPLLARLNAMPEAMEIITSSYVPDAAETLVQTGRLTEAATLIDRLEASGRKHDRPWMLAVGARCRGMLLAAEGDIETASVVAQQALDHHARLPMPFERARSTLLLGQLQRRQRHREAAARSIRAALEVFEDLNSSPWITRARTELERTVAVRNGDATELTSTETRVAELAASGMTNREVAGALFISAKTVEVNLSRVYRKLGIRSRTDLARRLR